MGLLLLVAPSAWAEERVITCEPSSGAERYVLQAVDAYKMDRWVDVVTVAAPADPTVRPVLRYTCPEKKWMILKLCSENARGRACQRTYGLWCYTVPLVLAP